MAKDKNHPEKIQDQIWTQKYRPETFDDLIFEDKSTILKYIENPLTVPSMILYSPTYGTGKTTTARLIAKKMEADILEINASKDRGIDVIRGKVLSFATSMSIDQSVKKCIFLDEAERLTDEAQDSLKSPIEMYSKYCFFIFATNDISKIIDAIKSRCVVFNFGNMDKKEILNRLKHISSQEKVNVTEQDLNKIIEVHYPDIRYMIKNLQHIKTTGKVNVVNTSFQEVIQAINKKDINFVYQKVYNDKDFDLHAFVRYFFRKLYDTPNIPLEKRAKAGKLLAEVEKSFALKVNAQIIFIANVNELMTIL